jgi:hypothetical protein
MLSKVDVLKIDTEGADFRVLQGAQGMLAKGAIDAIMTEVFFVPTYKGQASLDEMAAFLKTFGFRIFNIYIAREASCGQACYGNVIFVAKRLQGTIRTARETCSSEAHA